MARNIFGYKKVSITGKQSSAKYTESDIRWEKFKMVIWIVLAALYIYYIAQPQIHFQ
jgi:hypothetical protein